MMLSTLIIENGLTVAAAARRFGISGVNPGRTLDRIMSGERQPDADMISRIIEITAGAVTAADMHATRLDWLKTNRPERFAPEAAE
jgi:transcriptional regulator with XRE-family HTH domain